VCVCVCVVLGTQYAIRVSHIVVCGLSCSTIFFHIISQKVRISKTAIEIKMIVFLFSLRVLSKTFFLKRNERKRNMIKMHIDLNVKYKLILSDFN
jgi:hypothetical protein